MSTPVVFVYYAATATEASEVMDIARMKPGEVITLPIGSDLKFFDWIPWQRLYAEGLEVWGAEMWWSDFSSRREVLEH